MRCRRRKRFPSRRPTSLPWGPNECWSRNFITSILAAGRRFRCLTLIDDYIREWPGLEVEHSRPGTRIVDVLEGSAGTRGLTEVLICENGPELNRQALDACPIGTASTLDFIRPGKPDENCFIDNFKGSFRDECLNEYRFTTFADARRRIELWRRDYNQVRPHSSLGNPPR